MPRVCTACAHPDRKRIDGAIVEGVSHRDIARQFGIGRNAIDNHAEKHLPPTLTRSAEAAEVIHADDLITEIRAREKRADGLSALAVRNNDINAALRAIGEWRKLAEFRAKVAGELDERAVINVMLSPQWIEVRRTLVDCLQDHPAARVAVAAALHQLEGIGSHDGR